MLNYERTLVEHFGKDESLSSVLRFPLFLSTITDDAVTVIKQLRKRVPAAVLEYVQDFDAALPSDLANDSSYDFRVYLIAKTGAKTDADVAMTFVRYDELDEAQRKQLDIAQTIIREKLVPVADLGWHLAAQAAAQVEARLKRRFGTYEHTRAWKYFGVRPPEKSDHPERTSANFCHYSDAFRRYSYSDAWIDYLVRKLADPHLYEEVTGRVAADNEIA